MDFRSAINSLTHSSASNPCHPGNPWSITLLCVLLRLFAAIHFRVFGVFRGSLLFNLFVVFVSFCSALGFSCLSFRRILLPIRARFVSIRVTLDIGLFNHQLIKPSNHQPCFPSVPSGKSVVHHFALRSLAPLCGHSFPRVRRIRGSPSPPFPSVPACSISSLSSLPYVDEFGPDLLHTS